MSSTFLRAIALILSLTLSISVSAALPTSTNITSPLAVLSYGTFQGAYSSTYNITYFRKLPFAAPPVGVNRFRAPQPPDPITDGTYNSSATYDLCPQRTVNGSEDCLFLGLYSRPWDGTSLRPVVVNFYGGAFIEGGGSFNIPPSAWPILNVSAENDFVMVSQVALGLRSLARRIGGLRECTRSSPTTASTPLASSQAKRSPLIPTAT